jgi:hypothetical protein
VTVIVVPRSTQGFRRTGPRNRDRGHLERDFARVADDLRADPNSRWTVGHEIGARTGTSGQGGEAYFTLAIK